MQESRASNPSPESTINQGLLRSLKDGLPAYYSVKIDGFSRLVDLDIEKYESSTFHACGFNWRLILFPNGNAEKGVEGHISLCLAIEKTDCLPLGWEALVTCKMFVFDHKKDRYLTIQDDSEHQIQRFHQEQKECGFDRLISLKTFNDEANGYLLNDSCVFGVEVYEVKYSGIGEILKMFENPEEVTFEWKVFVDSTYSKKQHCSEEFTGGKHKWRISCDCEAVDCVSLYLELAESPLNIKKVLAKYSLVLMYLGRPLHRGEKSEYKWYSNAELSTDVTSRGFSEFPLENYVLFPLDDYVEVRGKVNIKAEVTNFS